MEAHDISIGALALLYQIRRNGLVQRFDTDAGRELVALGLAELKQNPSRIEITQEGRRSPLGNRA